MVTEAPPRPDVDLDALFAEPPPVCDGAFADVGCDNPAAWSLTKPCGHLPLLLCVSCRAEMVHAFVTILDMSCIVCGAPAPPIWRPL